jgi:hypothetical protein
MAKEQKTFVKGRMNKSVDERLLPDGEYIDALNIRLGSTELSEVGAVENSKGNVQLTTLKYKTVALSSSAVCIGAFDDSAEETMYWFVHDPNHSYGGVVDMIVSFNTQTQQLTYHVITTALLNFNPTYLVNGVNKIDDLLFFTDDYNPPRKINVTRGYAQPDGSNVDQIIELDISVIKPQPMNSPELTLQANQANDNFMEDTFLCFAYRYKYKDGEYSAISQFSDPAFIPSDFALERRSFTNGGMENAINNVVVEFNTGSENVIAIDVVFKEMDSNTIWVAKKLNKATHGYQNNSTESLVFSNGDIYTILSDGEILRLYDNVPRLARAQTIMGNRIMYGNYLEGYDLKDDNGNDIQLTYAVEQESAAQSAFAKEENRDCVGCLFPPPVPPSNPSLGNNYGITGVAQAGYTDVANEILVDLNTIPVNDLVDGALLTVAVEVRPSVVFTSNPNSFPNIQTLYYPFVGSPLNEIPEDQIPTTTVEFGYTVIGNHSDITSAFSGTSWDDQVGTSGNYQQSQSNWGDGFTFTDNYNSSVIVPYPIDSNYDNLIPIRSGWQNPNGNDPIRMYVDSGFLHVLPNAFNYNYVNLGPNDNIYMIPKLVSVRVTFKRAGNQKSLHSNRDYQVGIVYQDVDGRQSTVLESKLNSFHVSAYDSENINWAKVTIPSTMKPPYWADRYKFVMKQTETDYETIYSTTYFREVLGTDATDPTTNRVWVRLEGENANKVKEGQELYVKLDFSGAIDTPIKTTVLEVRSMAEGDIYETINTLDAPTPAGVYMLIVPDNFSISFDADTSVLTKAKLTEKTRNGVPYPETLKYPLYDNNGPWQILEGSTVKIKTHLHRREYDRIEQDVCGRETCNFEYEGVATQDYNNLRDFFLGEGVNIPLNSDCGPWGFDDDSGANVNRFYPDIFDYSNPNSTTRYTDPANAVRSTGSDAYDENHFQFTEDTSTGEFWFEIQSGTHHCWGGGTLARPSKIECEIAIYPANASLVFETIPTTTTGEIYFENGESFEISGGYHLSGDKVGDQDQALGQSAIVNLGFFNCYTFFNGVESYKIKDSITGKKIYLGNRVTAVSEQDYMEIRREASITYSGIFNAQNNVNKLNEFNLGLANYKDCEESYGPIQVLHSRRIDILTLQEDRISYVGVNTNVLTDAVGGGILTSVPQILGTQSSRIEEYGISENPESFCHYGRDVYFTDAKRSSVIQLKGGEGVDALNVISDVGMRSWFRDLFQTSFNRQKLGGYDPYMDEYVLSPNTNKLPFEVPVIECGGGDTQFTGLLEPQTFIVEFGNTFGNVTVSGNASVSTTVDVTYNGTTTSSGAVTGNFAVVFDKDVPSVTQATVTITPNAPATDSITIINSIACPIADFIRIIPIVITSADDNGLTRSQEFQFNDNTVGYTSPLWEDFNLTFLLQNQGYSGSSNIVSRFGPEINGYQGTGMIPMDGADVYMHSRRIKPNDTFYYNLSTNKMRYWRTSGTYNNNAADIATILTNSIPLTNTGTEPFVVGTFPMPPSTPPPAPADQFLYLVWDYREVNEIVLCVSPTISESCCECFSAPNCVPFLGFYSSVDSATACLGTPVSTFYTSVIVTGGIPNTIPIVGTTVFPSSGCSSDPNREFLQAGFIHFDDGGTDKWVQIDSDNIVIDSGNC